MKRDFNIDRYLDMASEDYSSFDADDLSDWDEYIGAGGGVYDEYMDEEDDYYMATGGGAAKTPSPYQVTITNTTASSANAVIFGRNRFLLSTNFGSDAGVTVTPSQTNITYLELLQQSAEQPFETSLIRVQSSNSSQVTQILTVTVKDANGQEATIPIISQSYFSAYQEQDTIIDIPFALKVDANAFITYPMLASTTAVMTFFPAEKVNTAKTLNGKVGVQTYGNPMVNIGGMKFPTKFVKRAPRGRRPLGAKKLS